MVYRLRWRSKRLEREIRIYGNRDSIRDTLAILLINKTLTLDLKVEAILDTTDGGDVRDVTQEFALEHIYDALRN